MPKVRLVRKEIISAAHQLHCDSLSPSENNALFGKCANLHGHNYEISVVIEGDVDPLTGLVMNFDELKSIIHTHVIRKIDHKNLNADVDEFKSLNPTAEHIAIVIWSWLQPSLTDLLVEVQVTESEKNTAIYRGN